MSSARRPSRRVLVASLLLLTIGIWHGEAIAGQLSLTWVDTSTGELGFSIERSTGTTGTFGEVAATGAGITDYADSSVADGTTYCYRVRAYNATAYSDYSNTSCGSTAQAYGLAVVKAGLGSGTVISSPSGIICGATCSASYASGTAVTLTATPATGSVFSGWSGGCAGTGTCTVTVTALTTVQATFDLAPLSFSVSNGGTGAGTVTSSPTGINCGSTCAATYAYGTAVTLTAAPATGSTFAGWGGACTGTGTCSVTLTAAAAVSATFNLAPSQSATLTVSRSGNGTVTSAPAGISCGTTCSASYASGTAVTLTATPATGSVLSGWSGGGCAGTGTCTVTVTAPTTVQATFVALQTLSVSKGGTGTGTVTSSPTGINCGSTCSATYPYGTAVTLTAAPATGSTFAGWGGACTGTGTCSVTLTAATAVSATFNLASAQSATLTVSRSGNGTVTSAPAGISCGTTCSASYASGTAVTLTATPATGSVLSGWSGGGCAGTGTCTVTVTALTTVQATFVAPQTLSVSKGGTGTGTVTSSPAGIDCGSTCSATYAYGTPVTLTATPATGSTFAGWGGACTGTGTCSATLSTATAVSATFNVAVPQSATLTVSLSGKGTVASVPAGISCGATCSARYPSGTVVVLTPTPGSNFVFKGWGGACGGMGTCSVTLTGTTAVSATFANQNKK